MAKSQQQTPKTETSKDPVEMGQAFMKQVEDAGLGPMRWMGTAWLENMADMNSEVVSFVANRIREDVKTQHELLHCKTAQELQKTQAAFLERAFSQYTDETGLLMKMGMDMLPNGNGKTKDTPV